MKIIWQTRRIFWKKHWASLLFWLLFPLVTTGFIISQFATLQEDTKIPVGVVVEENTPLVQDLVTSLQNTPHIRPVVLKEREALNQLQKHELDSVFIIRNHYEDSIRRGSRNQLVKSYQSDLSFAYTPLRETVISYVQQDYGRAKAAFVVQQIGDEYGVVDEWSMDELIGRGKEIVDEQKLLEVEFAFASTDGVGEEKNDSLLKPWNVWALLTLLATFMLFDWVIKESRSAVVQRFVFGKFSFKQYLLLNTILYTLLLFVFDLITMGLYFFFLGEEISYALVLALLSYRLVLSSCIFIFSTCFKSTYLYYTSSFAIVLLAALMSGALIPIEGIAAKFAWFEYVNPFGPFLAGTYLNVWLIIGMMLIGLWYVRKGEADA